MINIVFTGTWVQETRNDKTRRYDKKHINVQKGITKKTDVLIQGVNAGYSKLSKAKDYGIPVMTEEQFFKWLRENYPEYYL